MTSRTLIDPRPSAAIARSAAAELVVEVATLPGDQAAARREQREGELDEVGQRCHGTRGDGRPAAAMPSLGGQRLGPDRGGLDRRGEPGGLGDDRQEAGLLGDRFEEQRPRGRVRRRERDARVAAARPEVDEPVRSPFAQDGERGQAVDDVGDGDRRRVADGGQVDGRGPGEEQPGVTVDGGPRRRRRASGRAPRARRRARRRMRPGGSGCPERASGAARAVRPRHASCGSRAIRPRGATPGVGIGSHRGLSVRSSAVGPVRGRVSPSPSPTALPSHLPQCGCRTVEVEEALVNGVVHESSGRLRNRG